MMASKKIVSPASPNGVMFGYLYNMSTFMWGGVSFDSFKPVTLSFLQTSLGCFVGFVKING